MKPNRLSFALAFGLWCLSARATQDVVIQALDKSKITYYPPTGSGAWLSAATTSECGGDYMFSNSNSSSLTITFTGIAVSVNLIRYSSGARATIDLDGVTQGTVDTYLSTTDCYTPVFKKANLANTMHTIRITDATGNYVRRWLRFDSLTYTEYSPHETGQVTSSMSVASVSSVSVASASSAAAQASARARTRNRGGRIAGGVVGGILGFALIVGVVWFLLRKKKQSQSPQYPPPPPPPFQQGPSDSWKPQPSPYQMPTQPYQPQMMTPNMTPQPSSTTHFAPYPINGVHYQHSGMTNTNMTSSTPYGSPSPHPQSLYSERPMSQYAPQDAQNMANMVADIVTNRMQNQYGVAGAPQGPIPEPMEIASTGRHVTPVNPNAGYLGTPFQQNQHSGP